MKIFKPLLYLSILISIASCNESQQTQTVLVKPKNHDRNIDKYLTEIFITKYPTFAENELVRQKAFREFNKKIDSISKINKLEDIPLNIYSISKNPHGKGAIVQFYANEINPTNKSLPIKIIYNVFGLMSEKIASTLSETADRTYFIKGHHYIRATEAMASILANSTKYPTEQKILDKILDTYYINLGSFICKVDSVK